MKIVQRPFLISLIESEVPFFLSFLSTRNTTEGIIVYTIKKFQTQFSLLDDQQPNRPHPACDAENLAVVAGCPHFFKNEDSRNVTANGSHYHAKIMEYLLSEIQAYDVGDIWFLTRRTISKTVRATMDILRTGLHRWFVYLDRVMSHFWIIYFGVK